jgi:hypothetical protein
MKAVSLSNGSSMASDAPHLTFLRWAEKGAAFALVAALTLSGLPPLGNAQVTSRLTVASLEGSWSGGGTLSFAGGKEQARCKARFSRAGAHSFTVNATCATASGRAAQTATVRQVGTNRYSGRFYNSEYSISGVIDIIVRGSSQVVRLTSDSASAVLNLSR